MKSRFFSIVAALSMLLCVVLGTLWIAGRCLPAPPTPGAEHMQKLLARPVSDVMFNGVAIRDVTDFLRDVGFETMRPRSFGFRPGRPPPRIDVEDFDMNWAALQQAGIDPDTPVTISAQSVLFGVLVSKILAGTGLSCSADNRLLHLVASADRKSPMSAARKPARFWPRAASPVEQLIEMPLPEDLQPPRDDSLSDILQTVSNITGAKMSIDWGAIKQAGVSPDTSVTVNTANVTAGDMLALALRNAKPGAELQFMPRGDTIAISTRQAFDLRDRPKKLLFWGAASCCVSMICILAYRRRRNRYLPKALFFSLIVASSLMAACLTARIAFAVQPIEGVAFGQRWTLNPGRAGPSLWMTPADPMTPYLKNGPDSAFIDRFVRAGPQTQDWKYASVEVHHTGWPYEIWRIEWPNGSGVLLTSLLPIAWLIARTRKYWRQPNVGMCPRCGYDLRASSDYCPECGSAIEENTTISRA